MSGCRGWGRGHSPARHLQLAQEANLLSSCIEMRPLTLVGPRLTKRKTSQKRSGEVTVSLATILGWGWGVENWSHPSLAIPSPVLGLQRPARPLGTA